MSLAEHYGGSGGDWLTAGWHFVRVKKVECFTYPNTGSPGLKVTLEDRGEQKVEKDFVLGKLEKDKSISDKCLFNLAGFAEACGLTEEEARSYDPHDPTSHRVLLGKKLWIEVWKKDGKYSQVEDKAWKPESDPPTDAQKAESKAAGQVAQSSQAAPAQAAQSQATPASSGGNSLGDVPF